MTRARCVYQRGVALIGWLATSACDTTLPPSAAEHPDLGQSCAPLRASATTAPSPAPADSCPDEPDAGSDDDGEARALGFGYPLDTTLLPAHTAFLTFDDGPSEWTNDFLDVLKARGVHATFFITAEQLKGTLGLQGSYIDEYGVTEVFERLLKRELDEGHGLANHTVNHPDLGLVTDQQVESELDQNELQVNAGLMRAGAQPLILSLVRPPYGSPWFAGQGGVNAPAIARAQVAERIARHGLNVLWNIDSTDSVEWTQGESYSRTKRQDPSTGAPSFDDKVARIEQAVLSDALVASGAGIVVLMHDTHPTTLMALPSVLDGLVAAGYHFATIEDYVAMRWQRPSRELTPGPSARRQCTAERDWGCVTSQRSSALTDAVQVCGRMWSAYQALGGATRLGNALRAQTRAADTGIVSQVFERGVVELHPESAAPCNIVVRGP
jgi:peptidoglycan-N-acetylmuramic acid deacetylase